MSARGGKRHEHGGETFVTGGDAEHAFACGQRTHEAAEHHGGVVAIGQRIEHAFGALRASVAGVSAGPGKWRGMPAAELARGLGDEQADLPMAGVEAESDGGSVSGTQAAMRAEDEEFGVKEPLRLPAHAGILREAEEMSGWLGEEHFSRDGQRALRPARVRRHGGKECGVRLEHLRCGDGM